MKGKKEFLQFFWGSMWIYNSNEVEILTIRGVANNFLKKFFGQDQLCKPYVGFQIE